MSHANPLRLLFGALLVVVIGGCDCVGMVGEPDDAGTDGGDALMHDGGHRDAGQPDAGPADAGLDDAGLPDAGGDDAGLPDAGDEDAGLPDAGEDAGVPDAGNGEEVPDAAVALLPDGGYTCSSCHGGALNAAPPRDTQGYSRTTRRTVGAHQAHLGAEPWRRTLLCEDCHHVPTTVGENGHLDPSPAELTWGPVANAASVTSSFTGTSCTTYCHGQTLEGGTRREPEWTRAEPVDCGSCHGAPPPPPHTQNTACDTCHVNVFTEPERHIDGTLDLTIGCSSCHGDATSPAPPKDTRGRTATTVTSVGAHRSHLATSTWRKAISCAACHVVPSSVGQPGHIDASPAELTFSGVSNAASVTSSFNGFTCGTYCHGQTLASGTNKTPSWTTVNGTQAACGTCHGNPPAAPHPQNNQCAICHLDITAQPQRHIDGVLDVQTGCTSCHGDATSPAPPRDTQGLTATSARTVGAHRAHGGTSNWHKDIACTACHVVPATTGQLGHIDPAPAELSFTGVANADGVTSSFNGFTCGTYCHGQTLTSGTNKAPSWTTVNGSQAACGTCHGNPPALPHPQNNQCATCHLDITAQPQRHIDGVLDLSLTCSSCHGNATSSAPPADTHGVTATTARTVGAHRSHLGPSTWHKDIQCATCHTVPAAVGDPGHLDSSPAEVLTTGLVAANGATPTWNGTTCSNYCHGQTLDVGGTQRTPTWTSVGAGQAACGTCHGNPPPLPHPQNAACATCHNDITTQPQRHIDGVLDVTTSCTSCHGDATSPAPPRSLDGGTSTTARTVGAHRAHLGPSTWHKDLQCTACHVVPAAVGDPGHIDPSPAELVTTGLVSARGATPTWNGATCSNYCHGQTLGDGGTVTQPSWTQVGTGQAACGTCHGNPPPAPHPQNAQCAICHFDLTAQPQRHIDGVLDVKTGCSACHGNATSSAPPVDTHGVTVTTAVGVGAHRQHLGTSSSWHATMQCASCHVVPDAGDVTHIDNVATLTFSTIANTGNVSSSFNGTSCTTYCHGTTLQGGTNAAPTWTQVDGGQSACGTCHGLPPPAPHPQKTDCATCHYDVTAQPQRHIDGQLQVTLTCSSCHGDATTSAPPSDTTGRTATSVRTVGAHRSHLKASTWRAPIACADCHVVPGALDDPGHVDPAPAEVTFSAIASAHGATPAWTGTTCSNYCHGQTLGDGGTNVLPIWTAVDGGQAACGTCHGAPPPAPHPQNAACANCHLDIFTQPQKHIDGVLDVTVSCSSCHGNATSSAPPLDTHGVSATSARTVGAHRSHLGASTWHAEVTCDDCHTVPSLVDDPGHIDPSPAELSYGATARSRGAVPSWNGASCSNYCHGQTLDGGTNRTPTWTVVNGSQSACGTCHGLPPPAPHPQNTQCVLCHAAVVNAANAFVAPDLHINGTVEAQVTCGSCHAVPPSTGTHALHVGVNGTRTYGSLSTAATVGSTNGYAFGCGNCHPMDSARHMNGGRAEIELYNPLAPPGSLKARSPLATYTPGTTVFTDDAGIQYTKGTCSSVYCHSGPSYATPNAVPRPGVDFSFAGYPITYPTFALDVGRAFQPVTWGAVGTGCAACHGFPIRTNEATVHAGAGQTHSSLGATGLESGHAFNHNDAPLPCRTCHVQTVTAAGTTSRVGGVASYGAVAITGWSSHVNGRPDVVFDTANSVSSGGKAQSLSGASFNQATSTCSSVSCHKSQSAVVNGHPFRPDQVSLECNACHQF